MQANGCRQRAQDYLRLANTTNSSLRSVQLDSRDARRSSSKHRPVSIKVRLGTCRKKQSGLKKAHAVATPGPNMRGLIWPPVRATKMQQQVGIATRDWLADRRSNLRRLASELIRAKNALRS
jgi:hypothetical protein